MEMETEERLDLGIDRILLNAIVHGTVSLDLM